LQEEFNLDQEFEIVELEPRRATSPDAQFGSGGSGGSGSGGSGGSGGGSATIIGTIIPSGGGSGGSGGSIGSGGGSGT
jgi:hypothetical protein